MAYRKAVRGIRSACCSRKPVKASLSRWPTSRSISVKMLKAFRVDYCIVGHSERRQYFGETNESVRQKLRQLIDNNIKPIMCVDENIEQREAEKQFEIVGKQMSEALVGFTASDLKDLTIAYEPI